MKTMTVAGDEVRRMTEFSGEQLPGKREAILESAFEIFGRKGYHNTKIEEIAQHAGVGKGTIYLYFDSKEALLRDMLKERVRAYLAAVNRELDAAASPLDKLYALFETHLSLVHQNRHLIQMGGRDFGFVDEQMHKWFLQQKQALFAKIRDILEEGMRQGAFRNMDVQLAAGVLFSAMGAVYQADGQLLPQERARDVVSLLLSGLRAKPVSDTDVSQCACQPI